MNKKIIGYGSIALAVLLLFAFSFISLQDDSQQVVKRGLIPNIASPGLSYGGVNLTDHTVFNEAENTCIANNLNMRVSVWPCVGQDVDGRDIQQLVNFTWNGATPQNTSWIFVYDGDPLESGRMDLWQNTSYQAQVPGWEWINNYIVDRVISSQDLGNPSGVCDLGSLNNTRMFRVTRSTTNSTQYNQTICFTNVTALNATTYSISGNRDIIMNQTQYRMQWNDITSEIQYMGYGLLNDSRAYYKVQDVQFQPGQTYATRWHYTDQNVSTTGKWHIVGYNSDIGLTQSLTLGQYIYMDPWWDNNWQKKQRYALNYSLIATNQTNIPLFINLNSSNFNWGAVKADGGDLRIVNMSETGELNYSIRYFNSTEQKASITLLMPNTAVQQYVYLYYDNPAATRQDTAISAIYTNSYTSVWLLNGTGNDYKGGVNWAVSGTIPYDNSCLSGRCVTTGNTNTNANRFTYAGNIIGTKAGGSGTFEFWIRANNITAPTDPGFLYGKGQIGSCTNTLASIDSSTGVVTDSHGHQTGGMANGQWHLLTFSWGGGGSILYFDGVNIGAWQDGGGCSDTENFLHSFHTSSNGVYNRSFDTATLSNVQRSLSYSNVTYQNSKPTFWILSAEEQNNGVVSTLISPANAFATNNPNITFIANQTALGPTLLVNTTLFIWNASDNALIYQNTQSITGTENQTQWNQILGDGDYIWNVDVFGDGLEHDFDINRTFLVDTLLPVVNLYEPPNGTEFATLTVPYNVSFNSSVVENHPQACWFWNETANVTFTCGQNVSSLYGSGYHTAIFYANDTAGNVGQNQTTFLINLIQPNVTFPNPVVESQPFNVTFNLTAGLINTINATLNYNGTLIPMSIAQQNSTFARLVGSTSAPINISNNILMSIIVNYTLNGNNYATPQQNQTVLYLTPLIVAASCNDKAIAFNALDEQNLTSLNVDINYNFKFGFGSNNTLKAVYGSLTNVNPFYLCINSTVSNAYTLGYGEIDYQATGGTHVLRRYYTFEGKVLSNVTENVTLYDLANAQATSFLIEAKDSTLSPYVQKFLGLLRWYPQLNTYNLVEMAQTDENGRSIMRVKAEDVDYRVALWDVNGTLIKLNDPTRFACLTQPCTYSFTVFPTDQDYTSATGIQQSLTFNETTSRFVYVWNDPSGRTQTMNLTVYRETGVAVGPICESIGTGAIGAIQCDVTGYNGQLRAAVFRTASPATPIASLVWNIGQAISSVAKNMGLFISAILAIAGFFIGIFNPVIGIIMQIVSLVPSLYLGAIPQSVLIGFSIMGVVILHFMRRIFS